MQKFLLIVGSAMVLLGLAWPLLGRIGLGKLPGDISWKGEGYAVYFPLTTMILLSVLFTLILNYFPRLFK
ncbi:MAG: DUF2905 domain-containing protein [Nitrospinota bacterium]|nr:DUF2905 domain-containing protein [Nitrospinota bacterium]